MALRAHRLPFHVIPHEARGIGIMTPPPRWQPWRRRGYHINAIAQLDDSGAIAFLHSNLEKPAAAVETEFSDRPRRWRVVMPGHSAPVEPFATFIDAPEGYVSTPLRLLCVLRGTPYCRH